MSLKTCKPCKFTWGGDDAESRKYCPQCGKPLQDWMACKCGFVLEPSAKFCSACGKAVEEVNSENEEV